MCCMTFSYQHIQKIAAEMQPYGIFFKHKSVRGKGSKVRKLAEQEHCKGVYVHFCHPIIATTLVVCSLVAMWKLKLR